MSQSVHSTHVVTEVLVFIIISKNIIDTSGVSNEGCPVRKALGGYQVPYD